MKNLLYKLFTALFIVALIGCGGDKSKRSVEPPLPNMQPSFEALAATLVQAIADSNEKLLYDLVLTKDEYRDVVWASLDSTETRGMEMDMAWGWNVRDTDKAIMRFLGDYAGQQLQLTRIEPAKEIRERKQIKVHRGARLYVTPLNGEEEQWRILNVVLEYKGWFKVITYND